MGLPIDFIDHLFGAKGKQRLSIMIYHRVLPEYDYMRPGDPTVEAFDWHMELLSKYFSPLSLTDALNLMDAGQLPDRAVCVTFDDGYADNLLHALPVLDKWSVPATVFVATGYLDGGRMWNDIVLDSIKACNAQSIDLTDFGLKKYPTDNVLNKRESAHSILEAIKHLPVSIRTDVSNFIGSQGELIEDNLMLTSKQLSALVRNGIEIGAHTHTHPILCKLNAEEAKHEIESSKRELENKLASEIKYFAYPNGKFGADYNESHVEIVKKCGFSAALTTTKGVSGPGTDRLQLPRFTPWDTTRFRFLVRLMKNQRDIKKSIQVK